MIVTKLPVEVRDNQICESVHIVVNGKGFWCYRFTYGGKGNDGRTQRTVMAVTDEGRTVHQWRNW